MNRPVAFILTVALVAGVLAAGLFISRRVYPHIVGSARAPDGTEFCLVQEFNWSGEPFTTSFVYRKPGACWRRFYYGHQDLYWDQARAIVDSNQHVVVFYRGSSPAVTFHWDTEVYTHHRRNDTLTNCQWELPADWTPRKSVRASRKPRR